MDGGLDLRLVDPLGHDLRLGDLIPWPFSPADLGQAGVVPGRTPGSPSGDLAVADLAAPGDIAVALEVAGALAHAPYSRCPAAVALRLADGSVVAGAVLESVAFNPTIGPLEDALVGLVAAGRASVEIREAWLAERRGALVNHAAPARDLLAAVAPAVGLQTTYWR
jgi:cytidine deaminase